jgi:hypothetical protein
MNYTPHEPLSGLNAFIRLILGLALSLFGSYVVIIVLLKFKEILENPENLKIYLALVPQEEKLRTVMFQGQPLVLAPATFHYFAYGICILILMSAGILGGSLLKRGISLIVP